MTDEVNRYEEIAVALQKTYADLLEQDVKFVTRANPGYISPDPTTWGRDALVVRQALAAPGLISGLAKHLFGETDQ